MQRWFCGAWGMNVCSVRFLVPNQNFAHYFHLNPAVVFRLLHDWTQLARSSFQSSQIALFFTQFYMDIYCEKNKNLKCACVISLYCVCCCYCTWGYCFSLNNMVSIQSKWILFFKKLFYLMSDNILRFNMANNYYSIIRIL